MSPADSGIARSTAWIVLDRATAALCGLASLAIIGRSLGTEGLGSLAIVQAFVPLFLFFAEWGIGTAVSAELSRRGDASGRILGTAGLIRMPLCAAAWLACLGAAWLTGYRAERFEEVLIYSIILWLPVADGFSVVFPVAQRMGVPSVISIGSSGLQLALVAFCASAHLGVRSFLVAITLVCCVRSVGMALMALKRAGVPLGTDGDLARRLLRSGTLLSLAAVFTLAINSLPILVLERLHGAAAAGLYSVGARVLVIAYALPIALMTTVLPVMARGHEQDPERLHETFRKVRDLLFWLAVLIGVGATLLARPAIALVFGSAFAPAVVPFSILLWQPVLAFPWIVASNALIAQRRERANLILCAVTAAMTVVLCLALIPVWGAGGAAAAGVLSFLPVGFMSFVVVRRGTARGPIPEIETQGAGIAS